MKTIEAVLFDLDGTLLDTAPDFVRVVNDQRARHALKALAHEHIRPVVSNGARALIDLSFGIGPDHAEFAARLEELLELYYENIAVDTCLFPGMEDFLTLLESRGVPWGIVTNKPRRFSEPLLEALQLNQRCGILVCPDDVTHRKPHPEPMWLACGKLGCDPARSIYVGDHVRDIEAGRAAGLFTVAARYGYLSSPDEALAWAADLTIDSPLDLIHWIEQNQIELKGPGLRAHPES